MRTETRILLHGANLWYFGEGMFGPLFAVFTERIGGNVFDIAWAWATYLMVTGVLMVIIGKTTTTALRQKRLLVTGYILNAVLTFCYLLISTPTHLFLIQIGLGVAGALATPTWDSLYSHYQSKRMRSYIWGLAEGEAFMLTGIAILIGGYIVGTFSFTTLFIVMGTVQSIAALWQARILRRVRQ